MSFAYVCKREDKELSRLKVLKMNVFHDLHKYGWLFVACLLFGSLQAQETLTKQEAVTMIQVFFEGFHQGDTLKMKSVLSDVVIFQTVASPEISKNTLVTNDVKKLFLAVSSRADSEKWEEKLLDYKVEIDGNLAHVWTPYQFWRNGVFSHCGANAFTIARIASGWKIIHLIDSRRQANCLP
jgi:hypothetical protein